MSAAVAGRGTRGAALAEGAGGRRLLPSGTGTAGSTTREENRSRGEGGRQAADKRGLAGAERKLRGVRRRRWDGVH